MKQLSDNLPKHHTFHGEGRRNFGPDWKRWNRPMTTKHIRCTDSFCYSLLFKNFSEGSENSRAIIFRQFPDSEGNIGVGKKMPLFTGNTQTIRVWCNLLVTLFSNGSVKERFFTALATVLYGQDCFQTK